MQKRKKILLITAISIILSILIGIVAAATTINGRIFYSSNYSGNYYTGNGFGKGRSNEYFYNFTYESVKDKYYGFDGLTGSDYTAYIADSPDGYCLNSDTGTGAELFYVSDVVDIAGNKLTFNKSGKTTYGKQETTRMASAIYLKYAYTNGRDCSGTYTNEDDMRHWMTLGGGWYTFFRKYYPSYITDYTLRSTYGNPDARVYNGYVDKAIKNKLGYDYVNTISDYKELKDNNTTNPMAITGTYTVGSKSYKTKIGPYSLQLNTKSGITTTVKATAGGTTYTGAVNKESGYYYFYFENELPEAPTEIKVQQSYQGLKARLVLLGTGSSQARLIGRAKIDTITDELKIKKMPLFEIDVSLQKYITKLNGEDLVNGDTNGDTVLADRKNTYTATSEPDERAKKTVSKSEKDNMKADTYKKDENNIVLVEEGNTVTYRIYVYNNSDVTANSITIRDKALYYDNTSTQYSSYTIEKITRDGATADIKSQWKKVTGTATDEYEYTITNLAKNSSTYFDFTVKINKYEKDKILDNTAYIKETVPTNKDEYRTLDSDYIKLVQYGTSAKKYIETVSQGDSVVEVSREDFSGGMSEANPVLIEKGDIVTYKIKVTNTSDVETNVYVKDTISGFKYEDLLVSDWTYENGTGTLGKLTSDSESDELNCNGKMSSGATATCTVTMKIADIEDEGIGKNIIETWTQKEDPPPGDDPPGDDPPGDDPPGDDPPGDDPPGDDPEPGPTPTIPEYFQEKKYLASLHKIVSSANEKDTITGTGVEETRWDSWESDENKESEKAKTFDRHDNHITVKNGDTVTYTIRVKNDGTKLEDIQAEVQKLKATQLVQYTALRSYINQIIISSEEEAEEYRKKFEETLPKYEEASKKLNELLEKCTTFTITEIEDSLPNGVEFVSCSEGKYENGVITGLNLTLAPQEEKEITVTVKVTEPNISLNILRNEAKIKTIVNVNSEVVDDLTPKDNNDADYIQLNYGTDDPNDAIIAGTVWNDRTLNKGQDYYNGKWDEKDSNGNVLESKLQGIKVYLYRDGVGNIAVTTTDENGYYYFNDKTLDTEASKELTKNKELEAHERFIKAPRIEGKTRWDKSAGYYSYYIVFEYDGITYTSTPDGTSCQPITINTDYKIDSNASEDRGKVKEKREEFNADFSTINNESKIEYTTKNENGYIPQSNHIYNEATMSIQSSTNIINFNELTGYTPEDTDYTEYSKSEEELNTIEDQLKYIGLGLRGRDIFDLELTSDVHQIDVKVNNQVGVYKYSNKVNLRNSDINPEEDMANKANESEDAVVDRYTQDIREQELKASEKAVTSQTVNKYTDEQGLQEVKVTYKITITNASKTNGTATKIINYYDNRYEVIKAYSGEDELAVSNGEESGSGFKSVIITTKGTNISQSETTEVYLVLNLKNPRSTLSGLLTSTKAIPTYNMAEVYEYTTTSGEGQTEYTRGLIDKDSAPGSANKEQVRTTETIEIDTVTVEGNPTTVQYYFSKKANESVDLTKLKYEDDTYATPTLYFGIPTENNTRKLSGTIFRDETWVTADSIKTGNGIKDGSEPGIYGATVELVELNDVKDPDTVSKDEGTVRYRTNSDENGNYTFDNFLPGNYIVRYYFGDSKDTVVAHQYSGTINDYSFNGEDYQSTNNTGKIGLTEDSSIGLLNNTPGVWYAFNEKDKVSTGTENLARRQEVSTNVVGFNDTTMDALNDLRDKKDIDAAVLSKIINETSMYATTPNFTLSVEKTETDSENKNPEQRTQFSEYLVANMNFGIAEVPITTIDLQKHVKEYTITDSAGDNAIVKVERDETSPTGWKIKGNVLPGNKDGKTILDTSIEDEKLQGARLEVTYEVSTKIDVQKDFRTGEGVKPTITALADFIDNDLSYNATLGNNNTYWEVKTADDVKAAFQDYYNNNTIIGAVPKGTVDPNHTIHTSQVFAKSGNPILDEYGGTCEIILEKTLSSEEVTIGDIITSSINTYEYDNTVEILGLQYVNSEDPTGFRYRDRVRRPDKYIILPGTRHDSATSETITIHPPTGDTGISLTYYVVAAIGLAVLALGVFGIKKFVVKGKDTK